VEPRVGKIDQHGLARGVRSAVPAHEGQEVVDAEAERHQRPLDVAERAGNALRIDLLARRVERALDREVSSVGRLVHRRGAHCLYLTGAYKGRGAAGRVSISHWQPTTPRGEFVLLP